MPPERLPENYYFDGCGATFVSAPALCLFLLCAGLIFLVPRKYVIAPLLIGALLVPLGNVIVVGGMHWMLLRCLLLTGWVRILLSRFVSGDKRDGSGLTSLDKTFVLWAVSNAVMYTINWGTLGAFTNRLGFLYTTLGSFFLLRYLIRDSSDLMYTIRVLALVCMVVAPFMIVERLSGTNIYFEIFGGGQPAGYREGKIRAQGPFGHAIIAGTVGAVLLPLFIGLWKKDRRHRLWLCMGAAASGTMAFTSNSSTPVTAAVAGVGALGLWWLRGRMRLLRWGIVVALVSLQLLMKSDVWFLINRVGSLTGGSSWHRSQLVDQFIRHVGDWWLVGTKDNANWGIDLWDVDNAYVSAGFSGGLVPMVLFIALLVRGYKIIGTVRRMARHDSPTEWLVWAFGATLFANTVAFFGIVYFDQCSIVWYSLLAMICAVAEVVKPEPRSSAVAFSRRSTSCEVCP